MKRAGRDAARYFAAPDPEGAGALLYGADAMRVALRRAEVVAALVGPDGPQEMRISRLQAGDLRRDPAAATDALKAVGFFPGARVVLVEDAGDAQAPALKVALGDWRPGDAQLIVTAGALGAGSALRKAFEAAPRAVAIAIYDDPPGQAEIEAAIARVGLAAMGQSAMAEIDALARTLDPGDFAQLLEKLALYKLSDDAPLTPEDIAACAPQIVDADADEVLSLAAAGDAAGMVRAMRRLAGQGGSPTSLAIAAARHFRLLYGVASAPDGPEAALSRARPPVFGPRRTRLAEQARALGPARIERALAWIMDTDLALRSSRPAPGFALVERMFVRIAMLGRP